MPSVSGLSSLTALRTFEVHQRAIGRAMERLATGKRINRASDDPAGMAAANSLGARRATLEEVIKSAEQNSFLLSAADGGLSAAGDLLLELGGLVTTAANTGALTPAERDALQLQADSLLQSLDYVINTTTFGGRKILAETTTLELGGVVHTLPQLSLAALGLVGQAPPPDPSNPDAPAAPPARIVDLIDGDLGRVQATVRAAADQVNRLRAQVGALDRYAIGPGADLARTELENTLAAESTIADADFAAETAELVRNQTLAQASLAVIQIAQNQARGVLDLIRV